MPGVEIKPLYRDWLGLARGKPMPAELPRRAAAVPGVLRFRIFQLKQNLLELDISIRFKKLFVLKQNLKGIPE